MEYTSKTVVCRKPGISQEEALAGLYDAYGDVRVASIKRKGDAWVAQIQRRVAEFPPPKEEAPDAPEDAGDGPGGPPSGPEGDAPSDDAPEGDPTDGPPSLPGDDKGGDDKGKGDAAEHQILHLLHEIAQALGVGGGMDMLAPGDEPAPAPPPGPDMGAGADAPPLKKPTKLKPGEVLPTQTPIGAPAFSSVQKTATITVESARLNPQYMSPSQAEADLNRQFASHGYTVKQLRFDNQSSTYKALLSLH
ncbi:hypothetical protein [Candidatus Solirubrobacter pratensis]|uniref:hypothetical protein n=1 Tax=Candidatus Solirubrobacter pratensis TaxID=1298857 RepID=UPI00047F796A|nr:hypothetical protein [Candidatus Solirubrobacter pratensis]